MAKKVIPKQQKTETARHNKTAVPKWQVALETPERVYLDYSQLRDPQGGFDKTALWRANRDFGGKEIVVQESGTPRVFLNRKLFADENGTFTESGRQRYLKMQQKGRHVTFYDMPTSDPSASRFSEPSQPRPTQPAVTKKQVIKSDPNQPGVKHVQQQELVNGRWKNVGAAKEIRDEGVVTKQQQKLKVRQAASPQHARKLELKQQVDSLKRTIKNIRTTPQRWRAAVEDLRKLYVDLPHGMRGPVRDFLAARAPQASKKAIKKSASKLTKVRRHMSGETYDPSRPLGPHQYVSQGSNIVYNTSRERMRARRKAQFNREVRAAHRQDRADLKRMMRARRHAIAEERDKNRRRLKMIGRRATQRAALKAKYFSKLPKKSGFGRVPIRMLPGLKTAAGGVRNYKQVLRELPRSAQYPEMRHGTTQRAPQLQKMMPRGPQTVIATEQKMMLRGMRAFTTANAISVSKFAGIPRGIMIRIDAQAVITNLVDRYPKVLRAAAIATAQRIGRRLLDIVEPYVPKDTGLLYSTARTEVENTAGGLVDIAGGSPYPEGQMFGVSISYNAPYANIVYFDDTKRHGREYNEYHGTSEKDERETSRWIEVAFEKEQVSIRALQAEQAMAIISALNTVPPAKRR